MSRRHNLTGIFEQCSFFGGFLFSGRTIFLPCLAYNCRLCRSTRSAPSRLIKALMSKIDGEISEHLCLVSVLAQNPPTVHLCSRLLFLFVLLDLTHGGGRLLNRNRHCERLRRQWCARIYDIIGAPTNMYHAGFVDDYFYLVLGWYQLSIVVTCNT